MLKQIFQCPVCKEVCANPETLRLHRIDLHRGKIYKASYSTSREIEFYKQ